MQYTHTRVTSGAQDLKEIRYFWTSFWRSSERNLFALEAHAEAIDLSPRAYFKGNWTPTSSLCSILPAWSQLVAADYTALNIDIYM